MDVGLGEKEIATSRRQGYGRQARGTEGTREIFNRKIGKIAQSETRCMIAIVPPPRDAGCSLPLFLNFDLKKRVRE